MLFRRSLAFFVLPIVALCGPITNLRVDAVKVQAFYTLVKSTQLSIGDSVPIKNGMEIASPEYNTSLTFSVSPMKAKFWFGPYTFFTVHDVTTFDGGFSLVGKVRGKVDVKLEEIAEISNIVLSTEQAEMEIRSKSFSIETDGTRTYIECYDGEISLTNSLSMKTTQLLKGHSAIVFSTDGEKNTDIVIRSIPRWMQEKRERRLITETSSSTLPKSP